MNIYKWLDLPIKECIFSAQYYSPDREEKEEYVDKMLKKMKNMIKGEDMYEKAV